MTITSGTRGATATDFRAALAGLGFKPSTPLYGAIDYSERQFELVHPANPAVKLIAFINVVSPWRKDEYTDAAFYTLVNGHPLNVPNHPLNISVGLSEVHDAGLYAAIARATAARFCELEVDAFALNW